MTSYFKDATKWTKIKQNVSYLMFRLQWKTQLNRQTSLRVILILNNFNFTCDIMEIRSIPIQKSCNENGIYVL